MRSRVRLRGVCNGKRGKQGHVGIVDGLEVMEKEGVYIVFGNDVGGLGKATVLVDVARYRCSQKKNEYSLFDGRDIVVAYPIPQWLVGGDEDG